ncbi:hypothetical protein GCM10017044_15510 [Kordiimonas sediminis]|uniref:Alginate export domain-containing protein n=1 Tax=Kordiimonas sediminis TaxID=1735581 RepID=A0A919ATM8_9PROT|nr:alginate export family protein [Kordiimonas sediminis]GHF22280.1 hypothetical protein GCM10017044_15510 [Kordiimonas sediminis]
MRKVTTSVIALAMGMASVPALSSDAESVIDALSNGDVSLDLRYRLEMVDQDGLPDNATASTLRTKLGYKTGTYSGLSGYLEFENTLVLGSTSYNNTLNGKTSYPVVADPASTEINQAFLQYSAGNGFAFKAGRQGVNLGSQRYVGTVGWRQNDQTFDAVTAVYSADQLTAVYSYVWNVNRIFSNDHPLGNLKTQTNVLYAKYAASEYLNLEGTALLINLNTPNNAVDATLSSKTFSLRATGGTSPNEGLKIGYAVEYANQSDYATDKRDYNADYWNAELSASVRGFTVKLGYELLGSDNGLASFQTPLATLHKFNGFADKFLSTPANGLEDKFVQLSYKTSGDGPLSGINFMAVYHDFSADVGGADYGTEIDWVITKKLSKTFSLNVKGAHYSADSFATDTDKIMITLGAKF